MKIKNIIKSSILVKQEILNNDSLLETIIEVSQTAVKVLLSGGKILLCGNGGSAADAQHIAAELSGRYAFNRPPLDAEALHVNTSYLTAVANDYSFEEVYSRLIKAKGKQGDVLIAISTSGNSQNIINAIETANNNNLITIGLTGKSGGKMKNLCKYIINVPSDDTPRIQEAHILIGHIMCEIIETSIFKNYKNQDL